MILLRFQDVLGVGIEVYFIVTILAVLHYFLIRRVLRRWWPRYASNSALIAFLAVLAAPVAYMIIGVSIVLWISYYPEREFDAEEWRSEPGRRYELVDDLVASRSLIGSLSKDLDQLLGPPDAANATTSTYFLGHRPGLFNIDPDYLLIVHANGTVTGLEVHRD